MERYLRSSLIQVLRQLYITNNYIIFTEVQSSSVLGNVKVLEYTQICLNTSHIVTPPDFDGKRITYIYS